MLDCLACRPYPIGHLRRMKPASLGRVSFRSGVGLKCCHPEPTKMILRRAVHRQGRRDDRYRHHVDARTTPSRDCCRGKSAIQRCSSLYPSDLTEKGQCHACQRSVSQYTVNVVLLSQRVVAHTEPQSQRDIKAVRATDFVAGLARADDPHLLKCAPSNDVQGPTTYVLSETMRSATLSRLDFDLVCVSPTSKMTHRDAHRRPRRAHSDDKLALWRKTPKNSFKASPVMTHSPSAWPRYPKCLR